jgi:solute carrier family 13 (sodium-dependent dicarboxylate transporter), member 2/3/5
VLEPIPIYATSLLIIALQLVLISDKGFILFREGGQPEILGTLLNHREIMAAFASPIIMLFLGGFFLAIAATKYRLDQNLARVMLKPFGTNPGVLMLGLMIITAIFSMFMSNTATTAMMLSILVPVLALFPPEDRGRTAFALAIPVAANIGGIGTPIGTPPNAIALKYLVGDDHISFGQWMGFGVPYVVVLLLIAWLLLRYLFPVGIAEVKLDIKGKFLMTTKALTVYGVFAGTILLWLTDFLHGMNAYVVALLPVALFSATGIINKEDLKKVGWDVLWLVAGGIALGSALDKTGLAQRVVANIPFDTFPVLVVIFSTTVLSLVMANFMSHTATANLLLPIVAALATSMQGLDEFGGSKLLLLSVTIAASLGMALPISTPPNALAHGTGAIKTQEMTKVGVILGGVGLLLSYVLLFVLSMVGFL